MRFLADKRNDQAAHTFDTVINVKETRHAQGSPH